MAKIAITTLGCKLNQAESAQLTEMFVSRGYSMTPFNSTADVYIINSCTVTAKADSRCRQLIRKARRCAPDAVIIVTGCYAEVSADELEQIEGIDYILGSDYKFSIIQYLADLRKRQQPLVKTLGYAGHPGIGNFESGYFLENTRAFLKIQDGCNAFCAYCIVPFARGVPRSAEPVRIQKQVRELVDRGFREIVLTGAHIGLFGQDHEPPISLAALLEQIIAIKGDFQIRLSSIEPLEVTAELLDIIASSSKICPHLHIPLQSGDDTILQAMNRHYSTDQFIAIINQAVEKLPNAGLGTDVIVGFPGESDRMFENTLQTIERLPFNYLHVFTYSVRKGTAAAKLPNQIQNSVQTERSRRLRKIGRLKRDRYYRNHLQKIEPVLFEQTDNQGGVTGLSPNYIRVKVQGGADLINQIHPVKIVDFSDDFALGEIV